MSVQLGQRLTHPFFGRVPTTEERFLLYVDRTIGECWQFTGYTAGGYGRFAANGRSWLAHRWSYENFVGPIPDGLTLDHLCRNRACVNPAHLEPVTVGVNTLRGEGPTAVNARKTACPRGHELTPDNTFIIKATGGRTCRICRRKANSESRRRRSARSVERTT